MLNAYVILSVLFMFTKPKISIANFGRLTACGTPRSYASQGDSYAHFRRKFSIFY